MITCRDVTTWLLEADPSEIGAPAERAIAEHLTACNGCAARAARIVGDTAWLAHSIPAGPSRVRWRRSAYVATSLLAASILVLLLIRVPRTESEGAALVLRPDVASTATQRDTSEAHAEHHTPGPSPKGNLRVARRTAPRSTSPRLASAAAVAPVPVTARPEPAIPIRAERLDTLDAKLSGAVEARSSLAVDVVPSTGRYAVLGSTPKVTVVWFY